LYLYKFLFLKLFLFFQKKININNRELKELLNDRFKKIKRLGAGAQGTVYQVEDLKENGIK
jgi:hypothetical protein